MNKKLVVIIAIVMEIVWIAAVTQLVKIEKEKRKEKADLEQISNDTNTADNKKDPTKGTQGVAWGGPSEGYKTTKYVYSREEYIKKISEEPEALAKFLYAYMILEDYVTITSEKYSEIIADTVEIFNNDEEIHQKALKGAIEFMGNNFKKPDSEEKRVATRSDEMTYEEYMAWMEILRQAQTGPAPTAIETMPPENMPLATNTETGEPISSGP